MANVKQIIVPDLGGAADVDVIEVLVKEGDSINVEDSLITLESEKASMEIPATHAGVIQAIQVKVGDKVSEGDAILTVEVSATAEEEPAAEPVAEAANSVVEVKVPDIGGAVDVDVIEVSVKSGDEINKEDSIITLESEKASMEIPSPYSGKVEEVSVKVGDKVSQDSLILTMQAAGEIVEKAKPAAPAAKPQVAPAAAPVAPAAPASGELYAGPAVRRYAREFNLDLTKIKGTGRKGRITKQDVQEFVKAKLQQAESGGLGIPAAPVIDFSKFGEVETQPLSKIKKFSGKNLHRNWITVPHVTQFDSADITKLEKFRQEKKATAEQQGFKLTPLVFIMKAAVAALRAYPVFNSSLSSDGESLIMKKYFHIGVAVDTPNGLVVPVIRDVDQKGIFDLAKELGEISLQAREKGLTPAQMQGSCFTISSLGGIGGTAFTPIVNAPDVAILGVSRSSMQPVYQDGEFVPRLMLPLSLSYDHRVIDGAQGARFCRHLVEVLSDLRNIIL